MDANPPNIIVDRWPLMIRKVLLFLTFVSHLLACSLYTKRLAKDLYALYRLRVAHPYTDWTKPWVYQGKPMELMWFSLSFAFLYLCFLGWAFVYRKLLATDERRAEGGYLPLLLINAACVGGIGLFANRPDGASAVRLAVSTVLLIVMVLTIVFQVSGRMPRWDLQSLRSLQRPLAGVLAVSSKLLAVAFVVVVLLLSYDLLGLVFGNQVVLRNEFIEVSEKTVLDGKTYDNHDFIKSRLGHPQFASVDEFLATEQSDVLSSERYRSARNAFLAGQDATVRKFIELNAQGFKWQTLNRTFDLHNNQTMNPLNAWMLGVPLKETHNLYGLVIPALSRLYFAVADFSYDNWLRLAFFLEWFYFISIPVAIYLYTRSKELTFAVFVTVAGTSFYGIYEGYFYLLHAQIPINPIRHGLDFLAIIALGRCVQRRDTLSMVFLGVTCSLAIMLGDHFGIATTAAAAITLFVLVLSEEKSAKGLLKVALMTALALASFKYSNLNDHNRAVAYFIDGFFSWSSRDAIKSLLYLYSAIYLGLFFLHLKGMASRTWYLVLFLALYSNILAFHFVWHGQPADFVSLSVLAVLAPCLVKLALDSFGLERYGAAALLAVVLAAFPLHYLGFRDTKDAYERDVRSHQVHRWNLEVARFQSTMPPEPFANAVDLIKKYSAADDGIYIISKYDYMLPVLARKYSRMEYPNLPYFLITSREVQDIDRQLATERPKILFVDSDVMLDGQLWTANNFMTLSDPSLYAENRLRLSRLNELKKIFLRARGDYRLVEKGTVIDVYERRDRS